MQRTKGPYPNVNGNLWERFKNSKTFTLLVFGMSSSVNCERGKIGEQTVVMETGVLPSFRAPDRLGITELGSKVPPSAVLRPAPRPQVGVVPRPQERS